MFDEVERVRERRRQRMQKILLQSRDTLPPYMDELHDPIQEPYMPGRYFTEKAQDDIPPHIPPQELLGIQTFVSVLLVGIAYLMFQTNSGIPVAWKDGARDVLTRDFNFEGVAVWYQEKFGTTPTVLPVLTTKNSIPASTTATSPWKMTSAWKIVKPFDAKNTKVVLETKDTGEVMNGELGWVTSITEKEGFGKIVVINYAGDREMWFGHLEEVNVTLNEFVKQGDLIGKAKQTTQETKQVEIAVKDKERFIDPMGVIALE